MSTRPRTGDRVVVLNTDAWDYVEFTAGDVGTISKVFAGGEIYVAFDRLKDNPSLNQIHFWPHRWLINIGPLDLQTDDWADILVVKL